MNTESTPPIENSSGGWQCPQCQAWLPSGTFHVCPMSPKVEPLLLEFSLDPNLSEAVRILKQMAEALDRIQKDVATLRMRARRYE